MSETDGQRLIDEMELQRQSLRTEPLGEERTQDLEFPEGLSVKDVPTFTQLPLGVMELEIKGWSQEMTPKTEKSPISKKVVKVQFSVTHTADDKFVGLPNTKTFWMGTDADPTCKAPATWIANFGPLKKVLQKAKVATSDGIGFTNMMNASIGAHLLGEVKDIKAKKTGAVRRDIVNFFSVGERQLESPTVEHHAKQVVNGAQAAPPPVFDND